MDEVLPDGGFDDWATSKHLWRDFFLRASPPSSPFHSSLLLVTIMSLFERWRKELGDLEAMGRLRHLQPPTGRDFSSNDYLGYGARLFADAQPLPRGATASRLLRGHHPIWELVEDRIARWHDAEAALVFNAGYSANLGLLAAAIAPGDWVASDQFNHASIVDGLRLAKAERVVYPHRDVDFLDARLSEARRTSPPDRAYFIVTESLFSMEGDVAPLADLCDVAERHGANLIVDEAHATGCFGPQGSGVVDDLGLRGRVLATMHTGGKALGVVGAYVVGSRTLKDYLVNRSRPLIFSTALPPQVGRWWKDTLDRVWHDDAGRSRLHALAAGFRAELARLGVPAGGNHYIVPIPLGSDEAAVAVARRLQAAGFDVRAIRPPTVPPGTSRLRVSIHADHEASELAALARAIADAGDFPCPIG